MTQRQVLTRKPAPALAPAHRYDRFCANLPYGPSCSLSWFLEGSAVRVCDEQSTHARIVFRGPQTRPVVAPHRGPLHMFILLLAPDALCWLTGAGVDRYLNRICPLAAALDDSWQAMALDVLHAPTDEDRVKRIEKFRSRVGTPPDRGIERHLGDRPRDTASGLEPPYRERTYLPKGGANANLNDKCAP